MLRRVSRKRTNASKRGKEERGFSVFGRSKLRRGAREFFVSAGLRFSLFFLVSPHCRVFFRSSEIAFVFPYPKFFCCAACVCCCFPSLPTGSLFLPGRRSRSYPRPFFSLCAFDAAHIEEQRVNAHKTSPKKKKKKEILEENHPHWRKKTCAEIERKLSLGGLLLLKPESRPFACVYVYSASPAARARVHPCVL